MKLTKINIILITILLSRQIFAVDFDESFAPDLTDQNFKSTYCSINVPEKPEKTIQLPFQLSFFISPNPNGQEVAVIDAAFANRLILMENLQDKDLADEVKDIILLPGTVDPVFTPDGKYLTLPSSKFYEIEEAKKKGDKAKPIVAAFHGAPYQSVGQPDINVRTYNYISDPNPITKDENIFFTKVVLENKKIMGIFNREQQTIKKGHICKNKITGSLPMISPDGKYISYLDKNTNTTKIMRIGVDGNDCTEILDLGIPTGKVSFNFDQRNRQLAFHVERSNFKSGWFSEITTEFSTDSFILDIETFGNPNGEDEKWEVSGIKRLSMNSTPKTGTYYPRFTMDGGIIAAKTTINSNGDTVSNIVQYSAEQIRDIQSNDRAIIGQSQLSEPIECNSTPILAKQIALGRLFNSVCDTLTLPDQDKDSILVAPFIDSNSCVRLVEDFWNQSWLNGKIKQTSSKSDDLNYLDEISKQDLLSICPEAIGKNTDLKIEAEKINEKVLPDSELFQNKCAACHESGFNEVKGGIVFFHANENGGLVENHHNSENYAGINSYTAEMSILSLISNPADVRNVMPPAETFITKTERKRIAKYLLQYIDVNQVGIELLDELKTQIDQFSTTE